MSTQVNTKTSNNWTKIKCKLKSATKMKQQQQNQSAFYNSSWFYNLYIINNSNLSKSAITSRLTPRNVYTTRLFYKHKYTFSNNKNKKLYNNNMTSLLSIFFVLFSFAVCCAMSEQSVLRLCVTSGDFFECQQMAAATNNSLTCVSGRDKYECMKLINDERADIVNLNSEELYLAGRLYNLEPLAIEQHNGDTQLFKSVAVINTRARINSIADLKGKRSCHGALNSTFGFDVPIGLLLATLTMQPDCRGELHSVSKFFEQSCAPGPWSSNSLVDAELKKLFPSLCAACQNSTLCSASDEFFGDDGALRCLFDKSGDVAFTSHQTVQRFLAANQRLDRSILANFEYLCLDGSRLPLDQTPCEWAHKPTNVFVTSPSKRRLRDIYLTFLQRVFAHFVPYKPSWWRMRSFLSDSTRVTQIVAVPRNLQHWDKYLGNYISSIEKPLPGCEPNNITLCAHNALEELKCLDLQKAAFSQRIRPQLECKRAQSVQECIELVASRRADIVAADISALYEAKSDVIIQLEPTAIAVPTRQDYAIAVVRADSGIKFLYQLAGRRSCHGAHGSTAGWLAPLAVLTERSLLSARDCNKADQMADYFGASCAPGSADLRVNKFRSGFERLCALCKGAHQHQQQQPSTLLSFNSPTALALASSASASAFALDSSTQAAAALNASNNNNNLLLSSNSIDDSLAASDQCERSPTERYFGETGALRCLVEGSADVSFMSASSFARNVDGRSKLEWARAVPLALDSRNFRLVCRNGPSMPAADFEMCHLLELPGKVLLSTKFASLEDRVTLRRLLVQLVDKFSIESDSSSMFALFAPYQRESNLLFDDETARFVPLPVDRSNFDTLTRQHLDSSFQALPDLHKPAACKLMFSGAASELHAERAVSRALVVALGALLTFLMLVAN